MNKPSLPDLRTHGYLVTKLLGQNVEGGRMTWLGCLADDASQKVVLKQFSFLRPDASWSGYKSHLREIEVLELLDDPRVPEVLGHFESDHGFFMVQRHCPALNLAELKQPWNSAAVAKLATDLLDLLDLLHTQRPMILHRDLKPRNILYDPKRAQVYLVDFGLGRIGASSGASSVAVGTPGFMAPEQMLGKEIDGRSDLYGLGMTCVALLSGVAHKETHDLLDMSMQVNLGLLSPNTPRAMRDWLKKMTAPNPSARFGSAKEAGASLAGISQEPGNISTAVTSRKRPSSALSAPLHPRPAPPFFSSGVKKPPAKKEEERSSQGYKIKGKSSIGVRDVLDKLLWVCMGIGILFPLFAGFDECKQKKRNHQGSSVTEDFAVPQGAPTCEEIKAQYAKGVRTFKQFDLGRGCTLKLEGISVETIFMNAYVQRLHLVDSHITGAIRHACTTYHSDRQRTTSLILERVELGTKGQQGNEFMVCESNVQMRHVKHLYGRLLLKYADVQSRDMVSEAPILFLDDVRMTSKKGHYSFIQIANGSSLTSEEPVQLGRLIVKGRPVQNSEGIRWITGAAVPPLKNESELIVRGGTLSALNLMGRSRAELTEMSTEGDVILFDGSTLVLRGTTLRSPLGYRAGDGLAPEVVIDESQVEGEIPKEIMVSRLGRPKGADAVVP